MQYFPLADISQAFSKPEVGGFARFTVCGIRGKDPRACNRVTEVESRKSMVSDVYVARNPAWVLTPSILLRRQTH